MQSPRFSIVSAAVILVAVMVGGVIPWLGLGLIVMVLLVALGLLAYRVWQR